jgi:gamma-glutamyltranspeptidase / glutathione hydrolase
VAGLAVAGLALPSPGGAAIHGSRYRPPLRTHCGAVATVSPLAGAAAIGVLDEGGNAIDAAVTAVFAVGVTRPEFCGIGGGGFLVYRTADGRSAALDFREEAPAAYRYVPGMSVGPQFYFGTGHGVIGVPGTVAGLSAALDRFGTISLARAIAPAEKLARDGYEVSQEEASLLDQESQRLRLFGDAARNYLKLGLVPYSAGDRIQLPDYADSLAAIAAHGPGELYGGPIGKAIVDDMGGESQFYDGDRGAMTLADLRAYRPIWRSPLSTTYRGARVLVEPPPASGGLAMIEMLNILEGYPLGGYGALSANRIHLMAEAQKIAWADRNGYVGDPRFVDVPEDLLAAKGYAIRRRAEISPSRARDYKPGSGIVRAASAGGRADAGGHTTHVSVIDGRGNAAAITCTIEQVAGSAVVAPGTGFLLNNELTDFNEPGTGTEANAPAPRKRPRSSMSPTIVLRHGQPVLAVGGAGGPSIIEGAMNTLEYALDYGFDPAAAVDAPRTDARGICDGGGLQLCMEDARIPADVIAELRRRGHQVTLEGEYADVPQIQPVGVNAATGERLAASDTRGESGATVQRAGAALPRLLPLRLSVRPQHVRAGAPTRFRLQVTTVRRRRTEGVGRARVRIGKASVRTGSRGRATLRATMHRKGRRRAVAEQVGYAIAYGYFEVVAPDRR